MQSAASEDASNRLRYLQEKMDRLLGVASQPQPQPTTKPQSSIFPSSSSSSSSFAFLQDSKSSRNNNLTAANANGLDGEGLSLRDLLPNETTLHSKPESDFKRPIPVSNDWNDFFASSLSTQQPAASIPSSSSSAPSSSLSLAKTPSETFATFVKPSPPLVSVDSFISSLPSSAPTSSFLSLSRSRAPSPPSPSPIIRSSSEFPSTKLPIRSLLVEACAAGGVVNPANTRSLSAGRTRSSSALRLSSSSSFIRPSVLEPAQQLAARNPQSPLVNRASNKSLVRPLSPSPLPSYISPSEQENSSTLYISSSSSPFPSPLLSPVDRVMNEARSLRASLTSLSSQPNQVDRLSATQIHELVSLAAQITQIARSTKLYTQSARR